MRRLRSRALLRTLPPLLLAAICRRAALRPRGCRLCCLPPALTISPVLFLVALFDQEFEFGRQFQSLAAALFHFRRLALLLRLVANHCRPRPIFIRMRQAEVELRLRTW